MIDFKSTFGKATTDELKDIQILLADEIKHRAKTSAPLSPNRKTLITFTDGASRGNPGHAGAGFLIYDENDKKVVDGFQYLGICTNNEAEYRALLLALDKAHELTSGTVSCHMDSELLARQMNGQYAIKSEKLLVFFNEVKNKSRWFSSITFTHVPREHPKLQLADKLANKAIDEKNKGGVHGG